MEQICLLLYFSFLERMTGTIQYHIAVIFWYYQKLGFCAHSKRTFSWERLHHIQGWQTKSFRNI